MKNRITFINSFCIILFLNQYPFKLSFAKICFLTSKFIKEVDLSNNYESFIPLQKKTRTTALMANRDTPYTNQRTSSSSAKRDQDRDRNDSIFDNSGGQGIGLPTNFDSGDNNDYLLKRILRSAYETNNYDQVAKIINGQNESNALALLRLAKDRRPIEAEAILDNMAFHTIEQSLPLHLAEYFFLSYFSIRTKGLTSVEASLKVQKQMMVRSRKTNAREIESSSLEVAQAMDFSSDFILLLRKHGFGPALEPIEESAYIRAERRVVSRLCGFEVEDRLLEQRIDQAIATQNPDEIGVLLDLRRKPLYIRLLRGLMGYQRNEESDQLNQVVAVLLRHKVRETKRERILLLLLTGLFSNLPSSRTQFAGLLIPYISNNFRDALLPYHVSSAATALGLEHNFAESLYFQRTAGVRFIGEAAVLLLATQHTPSSIDFIEKHISREPDLDVRILMAHVLAAKERYEKAISESRKMIPLVVKAEGKSKTQKTLINLGIIFAIINYGCIYGLAHPTEIYDILKDDKRTLIERAIAAQVLMGRFSNQLFTYNDKEVSIKFRQVFSQALDNPAHSFNTTLDFKTSLLIGLATTSSSANALVDLYSFLTEGDIGNIQLRYYSIEIDPLFLQNAAQVFKNASQIPNIERHTHGLLSPQSLEQAALSIKSHVESISEN